MDYSRPETADLSAFRRAMKGARIDYADFTTGARITLPPTKGRINWHSGNSAFTIHDPTPDDLQALGGLPLTRLEVAVDVRPPPATPPEQRRHELADIFDCITRRIWPFDGQGLQRCYRASKGEGHNDWLVQTVYHGHEDGEGERRMPSIHETLYLGHRYDYPRADRSKPNTAQVRVYYKKTDNGEALPESKHVIRTEVTLATEWLRERGISRTGHLAGFSFRDQLSQYFRFLRPDADRVKDPATGGTALDRVLNDARGRMLTRAAMMGGVASWLFDEQAIVDVEQRDKEMCKAFATALDNLSRPYRPQKFCSL
ncbi:hypothetical protein ACFSHT_07135 [Paraburkholderia silviterrae]|uniref:Uncharacterized protein n=1 Tax=Paraburkholderia silviterrae TaxID=2528715 RepID=A0A4R5MCH8_9BURK|nr:hypothetical protein [Paraburkholderia silviterrae]TDG24665.1 hypothetical protein EYW47_08935 [Paraburkholderia silviterrae]